MAVTVPSKKTSLLALVAVIFLSGLIYFLFYVEGEETYVAPTVSTNAGNRLLAKDTDSDGLRDWEEQLWKSDPANPDSDNDGTNDGLEIKNGRNPAIAGPNDKLDLDTIESKINTETEADLSETDKFSRDLFLKIIAAKKADAPPSAEDLEDFLNASVLQEMKNQPVKTYGEGDFQVDKADTTEKIKAYGEKIAEIMNTEPSQPLEDELTIFERAEAKNDPNELKKLEPLIAQYRWIEDSLLKTIVPESALPNHIAFTNGVSGMAYSITGLRHIMTDPIRALPGVDVYDRNFANFINSLLRFKSYFETASVIFEKGDRGYNYFDKLVVPE